MEHDGLEQIKLRLYLQRLADFAALRTQNISDVVKWSKN